MFKPLNSLRIKLIFRSIYTTRNYSSASNHIQELMKLLAENLFPGSLIYDKYSISKYTVDWTKKYEGGSVVVKPNSVEQVSAVLAYCSANSIPVVSQGGNTGLVG